MITAEFDEHNPNWSGVNGQNQYFLHAVQAQVHELLRARGHVTLNEVFDMLGFEQTEEGALAGWVHDVDVDFGVSGGIGGETPIELSFNTNSTNVFRDK